MTFLRLRVVHTNTNYSDSASSNACEKDLALMGACPLVGPWWTGKGLQQTPAAQQPGACHKPDQTTKLQIRQERQTMQVAQSGAQTEIAPSGTQLQGTHL